MAPQGLSKGYDPGKYDFLASGPYDLSGSPRAENARSMRLVYDQVKGIFLTVPGEGCNIRTIPFHGKHGFCDYIHFRLATLLGIPNPLNGVF